MKRPTRRKLLKSAVASGAIMALTRSVSAASTSPATTRAAALTADDLAAADKVLAHAFTDSERKMAIGSMTAKRNLMHALRTREINPNLEPAIQFNPRLAGTKLPDGPSSFTLSDAPLPNYDGNVE